MNRIRERGDRVLDGAVLEQVDRRDAVVAKLEGDAGWLRLWIEPAGSTRARRQRPGRDDQTRGASLDDASSVHAGGLRAGAGIARGSARPARSRAAVTGRWRARGSRSRCSSRLRRGSRRRSVHAPPPAGGTQICFVQPLVRAPCRSRSSNCSRSCPPRSGSRRRPGRLRQASARRCRSRRPDRRRPCCSREARCRSRPRSSTPRPSRSCWSTRTARRRQRRRPRRRHRSRRQRRSTTRAASAGRIVGAGNAPVGVPSDRRRTRRLCDRPDTPRPAEGDRNRAAACPGVPRRPAGGAGPGCPTLPRRAAARPAIPVGHQGLDGAGRRTGQREHDSNATASVDRMRPRARALTMPDPRDVRPEKIRLFTRAARPRPSEN